MDEYFPLSATPEFPIRRGRCVQEGYLRGVGLEFKNLREQIAADPDYQEAFQYASGRSILMLDRIMNLFLLIKYFLPRIPVGHIIEYGSYRGGSAFFMAALARKFLPQTHVFALDTFSGMPATDPAIDAHHAGDFANTNADEVRSAATAFGLTNLHVVPGLFQDTATQVLQQAGAISLAHIDCDIYHAVKYSYEASRAYMVNGGYLVFDDATASSCIGATEAVEDFVIRRDGLCSEQIYPHFVFRNFIG
ncbi:TylF/MycF/NovP-related O-methyltransferase [Fundidesulfovibrio soli]|uniref:TylF/MycF/NovP-related O-methyltransferase n=1 Tax=Fundidesulfovibrio soli TaxID=2922716 RepID=UPI001FB02AE0|nr:TylF/MycF/NovP-related O-methyltransferase [Fundidesulfovibrio soli]